MGIVDEDEFDSTLWLLEVGGQVQVEAVPADADSLGFIMRASLRLAGFGVELSQFVRVGALDQAAEELAVEVRKVTNRWPRSPEPLSIPIAGRGIKGCGSGPGAPRIGGLT